jgi:hypothetical protein
MSAHNASPPSSGAGALASAPAAAAVAPVTSSVFARGAVTVSSPNVVYTPETIEATYNYEATSVAVDPATGAVTATPVSTPFVLTTRRVVPKTGERRRCARRGDRSCSVRRRCATGRLTPSTRSPPALQAS